MKMDGEYWKEKKREKENNWKWEGEENTVGIMTVKVLGSNKEHGEIYENKQDTGKMNDSREYCKILGARVKPIK